MQTIHQASIIGLLRIQRPTHEDIRGFFRESARIGELEQITGFPFTVAQVNHARSRKDTLRGIHIAPWNKLIYVTGGNVQAVVVDLRKDSATFGKHESFIIGDDDRSSIFIPKGMGNSYLVLSSNADYTYLTDQEWRPDKEIGVLWNDPDLNINWKTENPNLSEKDQKNPTFRSLFPGRF